MSTGAHLTALSTASYPEDEAPMPLQFNVATLLTEPVGSTREHDVDGNILIDGEQPQHLHSAGGATLLRTKHGVLVSAQLEGAQPGQCSRCLRDIELPLHIRFQEEFFSSIDPETGARLPKPDDPEAFVIDAHHLLDLEEAVRQYWTAGLPMQPLCQPDCRGLCPTCGKDLNEGPCACPPDDDSRWQALRGLARELETG
jgi:uncharacterized protein